MDGGCYPRGGAASISGTFAAHIARNGGEVRVRTAVEKIEVRNGRVEGVRLAGGTLVRAPVVISNADPGVTWGRLVEPEHAGRRIRRRMGHVRYSLSTLSLFLGVDMDLRAAGLDSGNCWFSRTPDVEASYQFAERTDLSRIDVIPGLFLTVTTLKDPSLRHDDLHTVEAICFASYDAFARWRGSEPGRRPKDYRRLKGYLADKMVDAIEEFVPGITGRVKLRALGTPLTNSRYLAASRGGIYGIEKSLRNLGPFAFPIRTHIKGLFQCGASTIAPGILGVTSSGLAAAEQVLGCTRADILNARGQELRVYPAEHPEAWPQDLRPRRAA
jgi:phytoene dehydrogenase-like protein